jgi:hypothetical protein
MDGDDRSSYNPALRFIPQLWGLAGDVVGAWDSNVRASQENDLNTDAILSFNEPDNCQPGTGGTCMSVSDAVDGYRAHMSQYGDVYKLGSPAVTNGPQGLEWTKEFLNQCSGCQIDFVPIHWYADYSPGIINYFKGYIQEFYDNVQVTFLHSITNPTSILTAT